MWQYIFNPFSKIPPKPMMLIGIIITVIGAFISYFQKTIFDGVFDAHTYMFITYSQAITANIVNVIVLCILLFIFGKIIYPETQMVDVLNTAFYYRIPLYILVFITNIRAMENIEFKIQDNLGNFGNLSLTNSELMILTIFATVSLGLLTYAVVILVNGFKNASQPKKWQHYLGFALVLIASEFISKFIIGLIV